MARRKLAAVDVNLVRYSRAGDKFHYRWAARRALRMIDPLSSVDCLTIEGSKESQAAGEYVIDVAEYSSSSQKREHVIYFQLKHSTKRTNTPFSLSELKTTLKGFSDRFAHTTLQKRCAFCFVTNRPVSARLKNGVAAIANGEKSLADLEKNLERITKLNGSRLRRFCSVLSFQDAEGDYIVQKQKLRGEISEFLAGFVDSQESSNLVELVEDRAMPKSEDGHVEGQIHREDVLQRLGVNSERELFPAPRVVEPLPHPIQREQHKIFLQTILNASTPIIIHAEGGVGKSVVARQLSNSLPRGSLGLVYDCFGGGKWRNESEPRHRPRDAFVQIANELAAKGLCRPLLPKLTTPNDAFFRDFIERIKQACTSLREINRRAVLVLFVDAADNAEMGAQESGQHAFAGSLLRETLPPACCLVELCRTERLHLLKPPSGVKKLELKPFSEAETAVHLRSWHLDATDDDVREFHRLSSNNPRVQANALASAHKNLPDLLISLGPTRTTLEEQIAAQLESAINRIRDQHTDIENRQVDAICRGLANLPPLIPLRVLAAAAEIDVSTIKSFISEFGHPLWQSDESVQFRDEPTETWFRNSFGADPSMIERFATLLDPLAKEFSYVAKALPKLWLKAGNYEQLISLALSEEHLPESNPIEQRDIRVYRLQFAFKAALKAGRLPDAIRLAFRAGEEMAGNERQLELLARNIDLVVQFQEAHRIQEYAYKGLLGGKSWQGSENIYSAALLSFFKDFRGEARSYLRSAQRWLQLYFEYRKKMEDKQPHFQDDLTTEDIVELTWSHLHLFGPTEAVRFISGWTPKSVVFEVTGRLVKKLIDAARFDEISAIARAGMRNPYLTIAISSELLKVCKFPPKETLQGSLKFLSAAKKKIQIPEPGIQQSGMVGAIVAFAEACAHYGFPRRRICKILDCYVPSSAILNLESEHRMPERRTFFRAASLRFVLTTKNEPEPKALLPKEKVVDPLRKQYATEARNKLSQVIGALLPWYFARAASIVQSSVSVDLTDIRKRSNAILDGRHLQYDPIPYEVPLPYFETLAFNKKLPRKALTDFLSYSVTRSDSKFWLRERLSVLRTSYRLAHTTTLRAVLEESCVQIIDADSNESPEERCDWLIRLARAVLSVSRADASAYFERAVEAVSKFGDEMTDRWEALVDIAKRSTVEGPSTPETAYRFVKCAEIIGETVAREKYWDRNEVFRVLLRLHPSSAFAALSRWRDRDVGWFKEQLEALASEAVNLGVLDATSTWCLSGFEGCNASSTFISACLSAEPNQAKRQRIFDAGLRDIALAQPPLRNIQDLVPISTKAKLDATELNRLIQQARHADREQANSRRSADFSSFEEKEDPRIRQILHGADVITSNGLAKVIRAENELDFPKQPDRFWSEIIKLVPDGRESEFLRTVVETNDVDYYDIRRVFVHARKVWLSKPSVKRQWPHFLTAMGKRFAVSFAQRYGLHFWLEGELPRDDEVEFVKSGMIEALADTPEMVGPRTFFGFISAVCPRITAAEASATLDFAMERFERHIEKDFGEGQWSAWLHPPDKITKAFTGLIWAALGAPQSWIRWEAAHCVRRLSESKCQAEIDSLLDWMITGGVEAFGSSRFPFYRLHAELYLVLGLARAAVDDASTLASHSAVFQKLALEGIPHALIQKHAARIALAIERCKPGTYSADIIRQLETVGISTLSPLVVKGDRRLRTPWHERNQVRTDLKFYFGWDFDEYWFKPLARVFGISGEEVMDLAREAAVDFVGVAEHEPINDPRKAQWRSLDYSRPNTWHDHGSYPKIDDYRFYYSYHALLCTAARLLKAMPVVKYSDQEWKDTSWEDWIERHDLTRQNGKWLADRRDPSPVQRRSWVFDHDRENWLWRVTAEDFFDIVANYNPIPKSLCVNGSWNDCAGEHIEHVNVTSAFVSGNMADSLAASLRSHPNPYQAQMPGYKADEDYALPPFEVTGWIKMNGGGDQRLDHLDPYAKQITYPPNEIGDSFQTLLELTGDEERRIWHSSNAAAVAVVSETWSERTIWQRDAPFRSGERIIASLDLLRRACDALSKDLMFCVRIQRTRERSYRSERDDYGYLLSSHKILVLSSDGILRDATKSYQIS